MSERFFVEKHFADGNIVWSQDNMDSTALTDTINEGYVTAEEDSPTRYLSVLDSTGDISLEHLNITLSNPKLEVEDVVEEYAVDDVVDQQEENNDQVVVFSVEGSDELYGMQTVQDEDGNLQKYQFQFRKNSEGHLEAIPETITLVSIEEDTASQPEEFAQNNAMQIYVEEDHSSEHILPDSHIEEEPQEEELVESSLEYEHEEVDIKPGVLQLQNVKQEMHEMEYESPEVDELEESEPEHEFKIIPHREEDFAYPALEDQQENDDNSMESADYQDTPEQNGVTERENTTDNVNDSDDNDFSIVDGIPVTGDIEGEPSEDPPEKPASNILKHALKTNKDSPKIVKKDNKLYLYVVQHPEKENVDTEVSNLCKTKVNPRSILKSSHAMLHGKNESESNVQDERSNKRFARCKEAMQAMLFHNFISKTTIPQAPVRKNRLPRKQKIKPVERMDEEIVVQEVMVSSNGFVEAVGGGVDKENLAVTEYVELTDSDDDYDPKKINRKKKKHRRRKIEITISDESDTSHDSVIDLDESDEEIPNNNNRPLKRKRGRPPKNSSKVDTPEAPKKPEIPCPKCDKSFPSQNSLKTHLQHHSLQSSIKRALPEYKYKCDTCASTFINSIKLKKHMCSKLFNCAVCKKKFSDLSNLNVHKRTHAKENLIKSTTVVPISPKKNKSQRVTRQSVQTFKVPKNKCKICGKLCSSAQILTVHMKSHKEYNCSTCAKSFVSQLILEKHLRENCVKSPQRKGKEVGNSSSSTRNQRFVVNRVKCEHCLKEFLSFRALFKHKVQEHGMEIPDKSVLEEKKVRVGAGIPASKRLQRVYTREK